MLALVLIEEKAVAEAAAGALTANDITVIRSRDPIRLLDSIAEMDPEAIIIRQKDYPLHSQMIAAFAKFYAPLRRCKIIVLGDEQMAFSQFTFISEKMFIDSPALLAQALLGTGHSGSHRGSRLVAKAQRIMKE